MGLDKDYELSQNIDLQNSPFTPITAPFTGSLNGQGYEIQNLKIEVRTKRAALFEELGAGGLIQNLGIAGLYVTSTNTNGSFANPIQLGALVARMSDGEIKNCYAKDGDSELDIAGGGEIYDHAGGLVGFQEGGNIIASYATGDVNGGENTAGNADYVGGLVGRLENGSIISSYATGNAHGGGIENSDSVGALVGEQNSGSIIGSYATGGANGGDGATESVGALVGRQHGGSIIGSYATGDANGGSGYNDAVGALVGRQNGGSIIGSYATGNANGGSGSNDYVGGLVGNQTGGSNTASYDFGNTANGGTGSGVDGSRPTGVTDENGLDSSNAGTQWGGPNSPWDFGTASQPPALKYITGATLSGTTVTYVCDASKLPSGLSCGDLLAGQR